MAGMLYLCALAACILGALSLPPIVPNSDKLCVDGQRIATPCVCCKKDCWFTVATLAAEELGHIPGTGGDDEAVNTLKLIRECIVAECALECVRHAPFQ